MLFGWIRYRAEWKAAILADARRLIDTFTSKLILRRTKGSVDAASTGRARPAIRQLSSSKSRASNRSLRGSMEDRYAPA